MSVEVTLVALAEEQRVVDIAAAVVDKLVVVVVVADTLAGVTVLVALLAAETAVSPYSSFAR